jgi:predicted RNA-binding Zn ribbon-like protein
MPDLVAGRLCLDFLNTVDPRHGDQRTDYLVDFDAILTWCDRADVALPRSVSWLRRRAADRPAEARAAHDRAIDMRESLYEVVSATATDHAVRRRSLEAVNQALGEAIGRRVLVPDERGGVREGWRPADALDQVLWPIAIDAWDLLTEPELDRVRECPGGGDCGWMFLDTSRSGTRRWCDMRTCGNRSKVRAHYERVH